MLWAALTLAIWLGLLCLPFQPWRTRERLDSARPRAGTDPYARVGDLNADLSDVCAVVPARDEAAHIGATLAALLRQGRDLDVIVIDDQSSDGTADIAGRAANVRVVTGQSVPAGWTGKLWALEQGCSLIDKRDKCYTLLLDADIELQPGLIAALRDKMQREQLQFASLMPALRMTGFWEKLLLPAFVYFFKLLYPFRLANDVRFRKLAAAAGGCILLETRALDQIGGFVALKDALIDDCTLARRVKAAGFNTWIGLTHSARSLRPYSDLAAIWSMVARSAYTQLHYSLPMLAALTLIFALAFWLPVYMAVFAPFGAGWLAVVALIAMAASYVPVLRFYDLSKVWALALPLIATLFLFMTWTSALRYHRGERARWKGRVYDRSEAGRAGHRLYPETITTALPQKLSR